MLQVKKRTPVGSSSGTHDAELSALIGQHCKKQDDSRKKWRILGLCCCVVLVVSLIVFSKSDWTTQPSVQDVMFVENPDIRKETWTKSVQKVSDGKDWDGHQDGSEIVGWEGQYQTASEIVAKAVENRAMCLPNRPPPQRHPPTFRVVHSPDRASAEIVENFFIKRGALLANNDRQTSIVWIRKQQCHHYLADYYNLDYLKRFPQHTRFNTVPGSCESHYSKDKFCLNTSTIPKKYRKGIIDCWVPSEPKHLKQLKEHIRNNKQKAGSSELSYIVKQAVNSGGMGMRLYTHDEMMRAEQQGKVSQGHMDMVMRYHSKGLHLIEGRKTDMRTYAYFSVDPVRIYVHEDGWLWVAQQKWNPNTKDIKVHVTNYSGRDSDSTLRRKLRMSLLHYGERFSADKWAQYWEVMKNALVTNILSYAHRMGCKPSKGMFATGKQLCNRYWQLYGIDVLHLHDLSVAKVLEINNDPGVIAFYTLPAGHKHTPKKQKMYHNVYGDTAEISGITPKSQSNPKGAFFETRSLSSEFDHRGGFHLAYPPPDGNFEPYAFYDRHLSKEDKAAHKELLDHVKIRRQNCNNQFIGRHHACENKVEMCKPQA